MAKETAKLEVVIDASKAVAGQKKYVKATRTMADGTKKTEKILVEFDKTLNKTGKTAGKLSGKIAGLVTGFSGLLILRKITRVVAGYQETMTMLRGVTGATTAEFKMLSDTARKLGATTRYSAKEAGEGLLFLARAGFTVRQAIEAIPATLNLATAGAMELGEAADVASNILSQFGLAARETERVVDVLVYTANSANTNVSQLAEAMKYAGTTAGKLGISVEETAAALGVLGDSGIQASMAGSGLSTTLLMLLDKSEKTEKALKYLGLTFDDVNPVKRGIIGAFKALADANLDAERASAIFGKRNVKTALTLTAGIEKVEKLTGAYKDNLHVAEKIALMMEDTLTGSFKSLNSAIEEVMLSVGDSGFAGAMKWAVDTVTYLIRNADKIMTNAIFWWMDLFARLNMRIEHWYQMVKHFANKAGEALVAPVMWALKQLTRAFTSIETALQGTKIDPGTDISGALLDTLATMDEIFTVQKSIKSIEDNYTFSLAKNLEIIQKKKALRVAELEGMSIATQKLAAQQKLLNAATGATSKKAPGPVGFDMSTEVVGADPRQREHILYLERLDIKYAAIAKAIKQTKDAQADWNKNALIGFQKQLNAYNRLKRMTDSIGDSFARAMEDMAVGAKTAKEAVRQLATEIARLVIREKITGPIARAISKGLSGTEPTKPEAYTAPEGWKMPSSPGPIRQAPAMPSSLSNWGGDTTNNQVVNINVTTPDANSFRRSRTQILGDMARATRRAET